MQFRFLVAALLGMTSLLGVSCTRAPAIRPSATPVVSAPVARPSVPQLNGRIDVPLSTIEFLIAEGTQRSRVEADLQHLTDVIGPRLTGSPAMRRANEWTAARLREYGADSVALEPWPFGVTWQRGPLTMRIVAPHERWIHAVSWAWAPGTGGRAVAGDVVYMDATTRADFDRRFRGKLRGAWVVLTRPFPRVNPDAATARDSARVDSLRRLLRVQPTQEQREFMVAREDLLLSERIAGEIIDGGKEFALLTMSGTPADIARYPRVVVANATLAELHRLLAGNVSVRVEVTAENAIGRDTVTQWNTVGGIRGSERPDEYVVLGAHLDSWDIGTGATDNAAGSVAVLEAARLLGALKATGVRPKRSIRFALFSGEEQGLLGAQYYVATHRAELPRIQAVMVLDNGTGRITAMSTQGWDEAYDLWRSMMTPLAPLGPFVVKTGRKTGTDHMVFEYFGVPAFNYDQLPRGYDHTHHSQLDVYDHAVPEDVRQAAIVMAVNALQLANIDIRLPHRARQ